MDEIEKNSQIVYFQPQNSIGFAINLMSFGVHQFEQIIKIKRLDEFKELCEKKFKDSPPDLAKVSEFALNQLIDCIRLTICFENFMKSMLLLNGFIIHKLDNNIFPDLYKAQFKRPIKLSEIQEIKKWELNDKLDIKDPNMKYQIQGVLVNTIGIKELLTNEYQSIFKISKDVLFTCEPFFKYRNNLHLYMTENINFSKKEYEKIVELIKFVNDHIVRIHNLLIDEIGKGEEYKLQKIYCEGS